MRGLGTTARQWVQVVSLRPRFPRSAAPIRFVVVARARTGSTLLLELLRSHPDVTTDGELLKRRRGTVPPLALASARSVRTARIARTHAYGFKAMIGQIESLRGGRTYLPALHARGFRIVCLTRRDLLLHALSLQYAVQFDRWHRRQGEASVYEPFAVDVDELLGVMARLEQQRHTGAALLAGVPHLDFTYEDDLLPPGAQQRTADTVFADLGLGSVPVASTLVPMAPASLHERVTNYDELVDRLASSPYTRFVPDQVEQPE